MTMSSGDFINIYPTELKFPFELRKQSACSLQLSNKTDQYIAFKVKTTNPKKYCVRPNAGVVLPGSSCNVTVTMQAQKEAPPDMQCKDKFLIQSVIAPSGTSNKDVTTEMFNKEDGKVIDEFKLRVVYVPANPPSPVPEGSEEGGSPRASLTEDESKSSSLPEAVSRSLEEPKAKSSPSEAWSLISRLTEEKASALQHNQKLRQELELIRKEISKSNAGSFSMLFVVLVGLIVYILCSLLVVPLFGTQVR
ncbi:vesicle-associated protein 1-3 [Nicotiana attenuata]|uniref:Vesicle-associated protein 1-3 n=1 Tax=Nicotiana attenuata TaxID=49451 RepID=A0A1J6JKR2_NICAT|nr:vesicle-associated protein 1-3 [Nicotiana attenuata]